MILALDLGNTNLFIGVYEDDKLLVTFRCYSDKTKSSDSYKEIISNFLKEEGLDFSKFTGAILSSVIPSLNRSIVNAVEKLLKVHCFLVSSKIKTGLKIKIDNPLELGADLVCDSVGAIKKYGYPCLIVDLGTATKYLVINDKGEFVGCVIHSGIKLSSQALSKNAAQLMDIDFEAPKHIIGRNSRDSLNSGAIYGSLATLFGLSDMIEKEMGYSLKKIVTGGNAMLIKEHLNDQFSYDETLILNGLIEIYNNNIKRIN